MEDKTKVGCTQDKI